MKFHAMLISSALVMWSCSPTIENSQSFRDTPKSVEQIQANLVSESSPAPLQCDLGIKAFETSVYKMVRSQCIACHETGPGPTFAVADINASYARLINYVRFQNIPQSYLVKKGGNQHCKSYGVDCGVDFNRVTAEIQNWWSGGESQCPSTAKNRTEELEMPKNLAKGQHQTMKWDLGTVNPSLANNFLEVEVERFTEPANGQEGSFRFGRPRLMAGGSNLYFRALRFVQNGNLVAKADSYSWIERTIGRNESPVISGAHQILIEEKSNADRVALAFDELSLVGPKKCLHQDVFEKNVYSAMVDRNCFACHAGGPDKEKGIPLAVKNFDMSGTLDRLCGSSLARADSLFPTLSPLISYPLRRANGHPGIFASPGEVTPTWTDWIGSEKD